METHFPLHAGPLPPDTLVIRLRLACGAVWDVPAEAILELAFRSYSSGDRGWYEDEKDARERGGRADGSQPKGEELRRILEANFDYEQETLESHWYDVSPHAEHVAGPRVEPPLDRLWAIEEQGGEIDLLTALPPKEQYRQGYGWRDVLTPPED